MNFDFLTNEIDEVVSLINDVFNENCNSESFQLLDNQKVLLLKNNNEVIGTVIITLKNNPVKNQKSYYLDYVCIKDDYQHQGYGKKIMEEVFKIAKENNIDYVELTSNKDRVIARKMYQDLGMNIKDTDIFIKKV